MRKLKATSSEIPQAHGGPILVVAYSGRYPPGSGGNEHAAEMVAYLDSALDATGAAAALFDLRDLDYVWGDAIGGLVLRLREKELNFLPSAIVASGRTALALKSLLDVGTVFTIAGTKLCSSMDEALRYLESAPRHEVG